MHEVYDNTSTSGDISPLVVMDLWRRAVLTYMELGEEKNKMFGQRERQVITRKIAQTNSFTTFRKGGMSIAESDKQSIKENVEHLQEEAEKMAIVDRYITLLRSMNNMMTYLDRLQSSIRQNEGTSLQRL